MDEKLTIDVLHAFGLKFYELQQGFAAIFNLCLKHRVFTEAEFHNEREFILSFPDMKKWEAFLAALKTAKAQADLEEALRRYEGPIQ
jgi:hypothetical protein